MKKIAILQPNYLPWKGVFDMINYVDTFVFLDTVQYTEHDWRNRNKIKTSSGLNWISVPVHNSGRRGQKILEAEIDNSKKWRRKHFNSFQMSYSKAKYYKEYKFILEELFQKKEWTHISDLNIESTILISDALGIQTEFVKASDLDLKVTDKNDVILEICKSLDAEVYVSGPAASDYIDEKKFEENGIDLEYFSYDYEEYPQLYGPFEHGVTILDLIFNCGKDAGKYIWGEKGHSL